MRLARDGTQRIAFYPSKLGGNQVAVIAAKSRQGDKTCWTKPRSSCAAAAMGIVKGRSPYEHDTWLTIERPVDDG